MHNDSLWKDLKTKYLQAICSDSPDESGKWRTVWQLFVEHPWYQSALRSCAAQVIRRSGAPTQWREDVEHEAMLLLVRHLQRTPDLRINLTLVEQYFPGWMRKIILRDCLQALRKLRRMHRRIAAVDPQIALMDGRRSLDAQIDFAQAVDRLEEPQRTVVWLYAKGFRVREIADSLGLNYWTAGRILERGLKSLRSRLDGFDT